jgi:hypothetical protein
MRQNTQIKSSVTADKSCSDAAEFEARLMHIKREIGFLNVFQHNQYV